MAWELGCDRSPSSDDRLMRRALEHSLRPGTRMIKRHERARTRSEIEGKCRRSAANHCRIGG